ncbi:hypothetical protein ES707_14474 [subsurface metagenome]
MARYLSSRSSLRRFRRSIFVVSVLVIIAASYYAYRVSYHDRPPGTQRAAETVAPVPEAGPEPTLSEIIPTPTSQPNPEVDELIAGAMACINAEPARIIEARDRLNELLPMPMSAEQRQLVKEQLSQLADRWLFSRTIFPQDKLCGSLQVRPGSLLSTIGKQFRVPYKILMEINNIPYAESLQAGQTIKVIDGPFHARIYHSTFTMDLYLQNTFVRSFPVGLGQPDMETPMGLWRVKPGGKLITPTWRDPISGKTYQPGDPDYPLGSRWIGLEGIKGDAVGRTGFAIHGTKDPNQIGTASSQGCIRLHNGDAILIYNLLIPGLSRVETVE